MTAEWAEVLNIDKIEYQGVLAHYGLTMEYVQSFEHTLKLLYVPPFAYFGNLFEDLEV